MTRTSAFNSCPLTRFSTSSSPADPPPGRSHESTGMTPWTQFLDSLAAYDLGDISRNMRGRASSSRQPCGSLRPTDRSGRRRGEAPGHSCSGRRKRPYPSTGKRNFRADRHEYLAPLRRLVRLRLARNGRFATLNVGQNEAPSVVQPSPNRVFVPTLSTVPTTIRPIHPMPASRAFPPGRISQSPSSWENCIAECMQAPLDPARD